MRVIFFFFFFGLQGWEGKVEGSWVNYKGIKES